MTTSGRILSGWLYHTDSRLRGKQDTCPNPKWSFQFHYQLEFLWWIYSCSLSITINKQAKIIQYLGPDEVDYCLTKIYFFIQIHCCQFMVYFHD